MQNPFLHWNSDLLQDGNAVDTFEICGVAREGTGVVKAEKIFLKI